MAAKGDVFSDNDSIANGAFQDARPAAGGEATVHLIWYGGAVEIYTDNGTNETLIHTPTAAAGYMEWCSFHVTNSEYIAIKNISGGAIRIGYMGIYTHDTT